jgi:hypothetical protein
MDEAEGDQLMAILNVPDSELKMLRETLCTAQHGLAYRPGDNARFQEHSRRIGALIAQIDIFRPLGPDGKHDNRHTPFCGCEDKP